MKTFKIGGVHPEENKLSANKPIEILPIPQKVFIPVTQHLGAPSTLVVEKGSQVKAGTLLAKADAFICANVHSSVSGTVEKIEDSVDASGYRKSTIVINVEGDEWESSIDRSTKIEHEISLTDKEIVDIIKSLGVVGLGGATFPTHIKYMVPDGKKAKYLIINAVECEPYLTCDHQLMLEHGEEIFIGISLLLRALDIEHAIVGIENNKKDAIELFQKIANRHFGIEICPLKLRYPQGGEKQLIDATIGRQVPSGALPIAVGAVVQNVATVYAVYEAIQKNKPLIDRVMTVTGESVTRRGNYLVRFGTPLADVIAQAGGIPEDTGKIIAGGPMMGRAMSNVNMPANKRTSGILIMTEAESVRSEPENCMRCGKCVEACPMGLEPFLLVRQAEMRLWDDMEQNAIMDCIECGCCLYSCPSNRPLLDYVRMGKATVGGIIRTRATQK